MRQEATGAPLPEPMWLVLGMTFLVGLAIGSFLNVVIHRVPRRLSLWRPGSHCPRCGAPIRWRDNIPLLSFLLLGGRCRACRHPISWLYPVIEGGTAALFVSLVLVRGWGWETALDAVFVSLLIVLGAIDARHRILPDAITYPGFVFAVGARALHPAGEGVRPLADLMLHEAHRSVIFEGALLWGIGLIAASGLLLLVLERADYRLVGRWLEAKEDASAATPHASESSLLGEKGRSVEAEKISVGSLSPEKSALVVALLLMGLFLLRGIQDPEGARAGARAALHAVQGAIVGGGALWLSRLGYYAWRRLEGVGFGDVKMMLVIGAFLGWMGAILTIFLASLLGSVYGVALMLWTGERNPKLPFGFFLSVGAGSVLFLAS